MWPQNLCFIPPNVALWLQDIRKTAEGDDELKENPIYGSNKVNSSSDSIYDNVDFSSEKCKMETWNPIAECDFKKGEITDENSYLTWPPRKFATRPSRRSLEDLSDSELFPNAGYSIEGDVNRLIHFNSLSNALSIVTRDITHGRRDLGESQKQEGEEPNLRGSMSNLLASHREKHTQDYSWTWLNAEKIILGTLTEEDRFTERSCDIGNERADFQKRIAFLNGNEIERAYGHELRDLASKYSEFFLPEGFARPNVNSIFDSEFVTEKPPVPPKRRKRKMNQKHSPQVSRIRRIRKTHLAKAKAVAIPTVRLSANSPGQMNSEYLKKEPTPDYYEVEASANNELEDKEAKKPLPFPAYDPELEYEISELLMMQRVTESSKERRRISIESKASPILAESNDIFQGCVKHIPETPVSTQSPRELSEKKMSEPDLGEFMGALTRVDVDEENNEKVKLFLESRKKKLHYRTKPKPPVKLREDIIIDWENDYENLSEPVVLEGKSVAAKKFPDFFLSSKVQLTGDCQSVGTTSSKDVLFDDETYAFALSYEQTGDCSDELSNAFSNDEISSLVSDASFPSPSNVGFGPNRVEMRNVCKSTPSEITEIVALYDKILKEKDPKCDTEAADKMSFSSISISDGLNSYSDFESDINETIAIGEIWFGEKSEENVSVISWEVSEDTFRGSDLRVDEKNAEDESESFNLRRLYTSKIEHKFEVTPSLNVYNEVRLGTIVEDEDKVSEIVGYGSGGEIKLRVKSSSETDLLKPGRGKASLGKIPSKSLDFFRDSLAEERLGLTLGLEKGDSITSDICEWMAKIRGIAFAEDQLFSNDEEWILSFDSEERAYFFEESSKKSLWALPDYSREETKPESNYPTQKSATESAINTETTAKLRLNKDGNQPRISVSTRSTKAQSMLIEPKLDLSPKDGNKTFSMPRDLSKIYGEIIRIGVLNKTKILENGKKLRKNWTPSFIVLTDSYLFFFKDAKSFQNMKNVLGSNGNHLCLSLQGAVIEKGDKISSRKNVYKISCSDNTDVLIQTDKTSDAEEWFKEIDSVIQKLPQESTAGDSPLLDSKSSSKVGRTKSLKVRSKDTGSMEDLNSTPEERQNKIKARLKKFFIRRPTVDSLKKKGIWKDEPVFGCSLEQITKNRNPRVPIFVEKCIECIESKEENMKTDGLYRASGNLSQVQKIRLEVDQNNLNIMKEEEDVHVLTGSLKLFFRELKEPLIPSKQLEPALLATDKQTRKERIKDFQKIVKSLPTPNYETLKFLLQHLLRVKEYHKFNRMNINNLAIVFGPTLMWPEQESANMALELMQQNVVIECLLKEFQEIFT